MAETETGQSRAISLALQLLGAAAGLGAVATVTGGGLLFLRFHALALPGDEAVSVLPKSVLLTVGLHALAIPVCLGIVATLVIVLIQPLHEDGRPKARFWVVLGLLVIPAAWAIYQVIHFEVPEAALLIITVLLAIGAIALVALHKTRRETSLAWTVGLAFVVAGVVLAVAKTLAAPVMEPVALVTKAGDYTVSGFYVGQTSDRFYMAPLPGGGQRDDAFADARVDRILEIPRETIKRTALRAPVGIRPDEPGREQATALLSELQAEGLPPVEPTVVTTARPVLAFAPMVHLHAHEDLWPISAEKFLENSWLLWAHDGDCGDYSPTLDEELKDPEQLSEKRGKDGFEFARLAKENPYRHKPVGDDCKTHGGAATFPASAHTRPYDKKARDPALPLKEGWYLDLDDKLGTGDKRVDQEGAQTVLTGIPVYYETFKEKIEKREGMRIVYWFFYALSRSPGPREIVDQFKHEGDWERISVLLQIEGKDRWLPVSARYHSHDEQRDIPWHALSLTSSIEEGLTHPVVFSARGSHASYARAGRYEAVFSPGGRKLLTVEDEAIACPRCPIWRTWERLLPAQPQPWYGFGGAWGDVRGQTGTTGPLGPSSYKTAGLSLSPNSTVAPDPDADISTAEPEHPEETEEELPEE